MEGRTHRLSEEDKIKTIAKLRNFPILPQQQQLQNNQDEVLASYFPWGCSRIGERVEFEPNDVVRWNNFHDYSNICLGIKYGICSFQKIQTLKLISQQFSQARKNSANFYLKLVAGDQVRNKILALVRVTEINPNKTFRFWHHQKGTVYPIGIAKIQVVAVGQIEEKHQNIVEVYRSLKGSMLDWKYFRAADDLERIQRQKYVIAITKNECQKLEEQLVEKNLSMINVLTRG